MDLYQLRSPPQINSCGIYQEFSKLVMRESGILNFVLVYCQQHDASELALLLLHAAYARLALAVIFFIWLKSPAG